MRAYVGLGANLGDREDTIRRAVALVDELAGVDVVSVSSLRETEPWGPVEQPRYLNGAVAVETDLPPRELLDALLEIERRLGRARDDEERWGPRTIDLDLLLYGGETMDTLDLTLPHPRMHERAFVLAPLVELDAGAMIAGRGQAAELLRACAGQAVERIEP